MSNYRHQQFWVSGSRFYFQRDPINGVIQPIIDFGVIDTANPEFDKNTIELDDGDGGVLQTVDEKVIKITESYPLTCYNFNPEMFAFLFSSDPPQELTQDVTPVTDVKHYAHPERLMAIHKTDYDLSDTPEFPAKQLGITSIDSIHDTQGGGGIAYVEGTDYEVVSLERGLIRWLSGGQLAAPGEVFVDFTPREISGERLIIPTTGYTTNPKGFGMLVWGRENFTQQTSRIARFSIISQTPAIAIEDYSSMELTAKVLADVGQAEPQGRIEYWLGELPDKA